MLAAYKAEEVCRYVTQTNCNFIRHRQSLYQSMPVTSSPCGHLVTASFTYLVLTALASPATAALFPTYSLSSTTKFPSSMGADIAGSAFVGVDGQFHFISSAADYEQSDSGGSFVNTYTADDFGVMANGNTSHVAYNTYWNRPGSMCYQLDKRSVRPMPSLYQDDHCDVVGVWIDPATETWYGVINDEYQFAPWQTNKTQNERIKTGLHNNRVLFASSSDQGVTWQLIDQLLTDGYQPEQTITSQLFPNTTYSWGLSGTRMFMDYVTGYAYVLYNHQVRNKVGDATLAKWFSLARAPLKDGLALDSWRKYYNGKWTEPRIGGKDGLIGEPLGFNVAYDPFTDYLAYEGIGADGKAVKYKSNPLVNGTFTFSDASGQMYSVNTVSKSISKNGQTVSTVSYHDPALNRVIALGLNGKAQITINSTDSYGATTVFVPASTKTVFKDTTTGRLYVQPTTINESAFTYNVQARKYRSVGYDNYVYENNDMGKPNNWIPVGEQPASVSAHAAYTSSLDTGSLTNQNVGTRTYSILSDLYSTIDTVTMTPHSVGQTSFSHDAVPNDANGKPLDVTESYEVSIGGIQLGTSLRFEPIKDTYATAYNTGFHRVKNTSGNYLRVTGTTPAEQRKWGAGTTFGAALPEYNPSGNGGHGSPGSSDQWYILPFGANTPSVIDANSPQDVVTDAQRTSLDDAAGYKLVNRNSGLVLVSKGGQFVLAPNDFAKNNAHKLAIQPNSVARRSRIMGAL